MEWTGARLLRVCRDFVRRLKLLWQRLGKVKIAEMLCGAGLHLAPTTVGKMLEEQPRFPEPLAAIVAGGPVVTANRPNHIWHIDSAVPTRLGFWVHWTPGAFPQEWPFCYWIALPGPDHPGSGNDASSPHL